MWITSENSMLYINSISRDQENGDIIVTTVTIM